MIPLAGSVGVEEPQGHGLGAVAVGEVADLVLIDPLGDRVVVSEGWLRVLEQVALVDGFGVCLAINLGGGREDVAEPAFALELEDVAGADGVGAPYLLVVLLTVDAPELGGQVKDQVKVADPVKGSPQLPIITDVGAHRLGEAGVLQLHTPDVVAAFPQLGDKGAS